MAELFLDIHDSRCVRAIVTDNGTVSFRNTYLLQPPVHHSASAAEPADNPPVLPAGWLPDILASIRQDAGVSVDQAHIIVPATDVQNSIHKLPLMPEADARKLITRKTFNNNDDEAPNIHLTQMAVEQKNQEWLAEYVTADTLKAYKKIFSTAGIKLKSLSTALDATLLAIAEIRESIFNAHAVIEINSSTIEICYVSATTLLQQETLTITVEDSPGDDSGQELSSRKRSFAILDLLYHANSRYMATFSMIPVQKVWLCGSDRAITDLAATLQDAMDIETQLLADPGESAFVVVNGLVTGIRNGQSANLVNPDLLRRFPLKKQSGMLVYVVTLLLAVLIVINTERQHIRVKKQDVDTRKALAAQKSNQTASAAIAKNLETLRRLTGSQIIFYPIFRELAMELPDGVFLDSFVFSGKESHEVIEFTASFPHTNDLGTTKTLSKITEIMKRSPYLNKFREPIVTSVTAGQKKTMTVKFTCEVKPHDPAK